MIIYNKIIPFKGFAAMAVFPFIFVRGNAKITPKTLNHEKIHFAQQKELMVTILSIMLIFDIFSMIVFKYALPIWSFSFSVLFFYLLYLIFFLIKGYKNIPFEKEAYTNQSDFNYLKKRKFFAWLKYIK